MLPCPRCDEHLYPVPKFDLGRDDVADFVNDLRGFHEQFAEALYEANPGSIFSTSWLDNLARWSANPLNP